MKKIIICILSIIVIFSSIVFVNKLNKNYIMYNGVMLALSLDGKNITYFPNEKNYKVDVQCKNSKGTWLVEDWKLSISDITGNATCNVEFTTRTESDKLKKYIKNNAYHIERFGDYTNSNILSENNMKNITKYSSNASSSESGNTTDVFLNNNEVWSVDTSKISSGNYYHFSFNVSEDAYYRICYSIGATKNSSNYIYAFINNERIDIDGYDYVYASSSNEKNGCVDLGKLNSGDNIRITRRVNQSSSSYSIPESTFYIEKSLIEEENYRYNGSNPNNYIWFNNELWRIIGIVPTKTNNDGKVENLIKLIKEESLGALVYDKHNTYNGEYRSTNTLYILLNNYYYGKLNGTDSGYCLSYIYKTNCDYSSIGISPTDYYGKMIRNVYWNTGMSEYYYSPHVMYILERKKQKVSGYVGIINSSDYGYASKSEYYNTNSSDFDTLDQTLSNWLYTGINLRTLTQKYETDTSGWRLDYVHNVSKNGSIYESDGDTALDIRPVVYLDPSVYVVSGDGTEANPYQIAME